MSDSNDEKTNAGRNSDGKSDRFRRNERKWTRPLTAAGWLTFPEVFLEHQHTLGLDATDINILLHLARYWWVAGNLPHPSKRTIAERMGVDVGTVRRRIAKMEKKGLVERKARYGTDDRQEANDYDFAGLIKAATPLAKTMTERRRERKRAAAAKLTRKRTPAKSGVKTDGASRGAGGKNALTGPGA